MKGRESERCGSLCGIPDSSRPLDRERRWRGTPPPPRPPVPSRVNKPCENVMPQPVSAPTSLLIANTYLECKAARLPGRATASTMPRPDGTTRAKRDPKHGPVPREPRGTTFQCGGRSYHASENTQDVIGSA